jgi:hypothetical protein
MRMEDDGLPVPVKRGRGSYIGCCATFEAAAGASHSKDIARRTLKGQLEWSLRACSVTADQPRGVVSNSCWVDAARD